MATDPEGLPSPDSAPDNIEPSSEQREMIDAELMRLERMEETTQKIRKTLGNSSDDEPSTDEVRQTEDAEREKRRLLQAEKVKRLRFEVLTPAQLDDVGALYNKHLLSTEALEDWCKEGDSEQITQEINHRGQMFNEFDPDPDTLAEYRKINPDYISVREQMRRDMEESEKGDSPCGNYIVVGLYDDKKPGVLRGYLSLRYPPRDPEFKKIYADSLTAALASQDKIADKELQFNREWVVARTVGEFPDMAEIDTIQIENGFSGASYLLLFKAIEHMRECGFEDPGSIIYYRSHTMTLRKNGKPLASEPLTEQNILGVLDNQDDPPDTVNVQNLHSARFFSSLGYTECMIRSDPQDVMIRRLSDGQWHRANMQWQYGHEKFSKMTERLTKQMKIRHLLD